MAGSLAETPKMGRPKIEGLVSLNLRLLKADLDGLDRIVAAEQTQRGDPGLTRTDLLREAVSAYVRGHNATKAPRRPR